MDWTDLLGNIFDSTGSGGDATTYYPNVTENFGNYTDQGPAAGANQTYGMIDNGNGTFTDPSTGFMYDQYGQSLGQTDPNYDPYGNQSGVGQGSGPDATGTGAGGGGTGGTGGTDPSGILKALGGIPGLAGILAPLLGGLYAANKTSQATNQVLGGIQNANTDIKSILGGTSAFAPYVQSGQGALSNLNNMKWTPLNYGPLGGTPQTTSGLTLGSLTSKGR